ncbi:hypothetical protein MOBUDSM44075_04234 [Mycolicibacterium obuense]|uniref:Uncharacterized protein n=1 Tax=Mycolicibacterium obuense TaxID=1807 RepID=A0A0J6VNK5_9MYCO|nr:hypothetical protein MOBUDSM44075_04234 [Mycolicibacterium obuense]
MATGVPIGTTVPVDAEVNGAVIVAYTVASVGP